MNPPRRREAESRETGIPDAPAGHAAGRLRRAIASALRTVRQGPA
jgi:hypothetical protein